MSGNDLRYTVFNTERGWVAVLGSSRGLVRITLPRPSPEEAQKLLGDDAGRAVPSFHRFTAIICRLRKYFAGSAAEFPDSLDLGEATAFQRRVWEAARLIPRGQTRSYAWVARQIGRPGAARAVGQALGRNPLPPIVPCHRVLAGDGGLGGFSGGLELKKYLLSLEDPAAIL
jgi:methylated-DNA-[protein]-cysteine S-methyltransferase